MSLFLQRLYEIRQSLDCVFAPDTAVMGAAGATRSYGHCGAVAVILHRLLGGEYVSAIVDGQSHWFNRIQFGGKTLDIDLTGDQFGRPAIQAHFRDDVGCDLYPGARLRRADEVNADTLRRAELLAERAGLELPPTCPAS